MGSEACCPLGLVMLSGDSTGVVVWPARACYGLVSWGDASRLPMSAAAASHYSAGAANEWHAAFSGLAHWPSFATQPAQPQVASPAVAMHPAPASFCQAASRLVPCFTEKRVQWWPGLLVMRLLGV